MEFCILIVQEISPVGLLMWISHQLWHQQQHLSLTCLLKSVSNWPFKPKPGWLKLDWLKPGWLKPDWLKPFSGCLGPSSEGELTDAFSPEFCREVPLLPLSLLLSKSLSASILQQDKHLSHRPHFSTFWLHPLVVIVTIRFPINQVEECPPWRTNSVVGNRLGLALQGEKVYRAIRSMDVSVNSS